MYTSENVLKINNTG